LGGGVTDTGKVSGSSAAWRKGSSLVYRFAYPAAAQQPRRADLLLLRRKDMSPRDHEARVLRGLWPLLGPVTLAELKGPTSGFRSKDLLRLLGYGVQYHELQMQALAGPAELTLALLTPAETPSLQAAIEHMGWRLERLDSGYARIVGAWYTTLVAFIDGVCEAERDDYLRLFSRHEKQSLEALWWLNTRRLRMTTMENEHELEGYDDLRKRLLSTFKPEEVLSTFKLEEVLRQYKPEDILRHYGLEQLLGHLGDLTPAERAEIEGKLPPELREALRKYVDGTP
jgi:hypothetical protein